MPPVSKSHRVFIAKHSPDDFPLFVERQRFATATIWEHTHDCIEMVYVLKGSGTNIIAGQSYPIISGDFYVIEPDATHAFSSAAGLELYNVLFRPALYTGSELAELRSLPHFAAFFLVEGLRRERRKLTFAPPYSDVLSASLERVAAELSSQAPGHRMVAKALFTDVLVQVCRRWTEQLPAQAVDRDGPVAQVLTYVHQHFHEHLSVDDLAAVTEVSAGHLGEVFKAKTGQSLHQYLTNVRLDHARQLLETTSLTITAICHHAGFDDSNYFTRVFRRATGLSPRAFRAQKR